MSGGEGGRSGGGEISRDLWAGWRAQVPMAGWLEALVLAGGSAVRQVGWTATLASSVVASVDMAARMAEGGASK